MRNLQYFDGYFMHNVRVYAQKFGGVFLPIVHRSGSLPVVAGTKQTAPHSSWDFGVPLAGVQSFATAAEAVAFAKKKVDETTGAYCRDFYYQPR